VGVAGRVHGLECALCGAKGIAVWRLHIGPRKLGDLNAFSAGFKYICDGENSKFICSGCRSEIREIPSDRSVSEALREIWPSSEEKLPEELESLIGRVG
jgi:hypothetical protein